MKHWACGGPLTFRYGPSGLRCFTNTEESAIDFGRGLAKSLLVPKPIRILSGTVPVDMLRQESIGIREVYASTQPIWEIQFESPVSLDVIENVTIQRVLE